MNQVDYISELIEDRQTYLRSLAARPLPGVETPSVRQRAGHALVRLGQWVEGKRPEGRAGYHAPLPSAAARLAKVSR
jgi:hypothetical protein